MSCIDQHRAAIGRWHIFCINRPKKTKRTFNSELGASLIGMARRFRPSLVLLTLLTTLLLLQNGDVEPNPGPMQDLSICHINARSLCPNDRSKRIDEIHTLLCIEQHFDVICVSETWLHHDILDSSIDIPNYISAI